MAPDADWTIQRDEIVQFHQGLLSRDETVTKIFIRFMDSDTGGSSVREAGGVKDGQLMERAVPKGGSPRPLPTRDGDEAQTLADSAARALSRTVELELDRLEHHRQPPECGAFGFWGSYGMKTPGRRKTVLSAVVLASPSAPPSYT